jgi:hypothetical protein
MTGASYFYITALPALGDLGTTPPVGSASILEHLADHRAGLSLVRAVFLHDDLLQREALLAGEIDEVDPVVLTPQQARNEAPLPEFLAPPREEEASRPAPADDLWEAYFRHAAEVARQQNSTFLGEWVGFEVALRNALAEARAKRLELEAQPYLVARDLGAEGLDLGPVLAEWSAAATPLAGHRALLRGRWDWLAQHDAWFSFQDDELPAYAAKLMLLCQWQRTAEEEQ